MTAGVGSLWLGVFLAFALSVEPDATAAAYEDHAAPSPLRRPLVHAGFESVEEAFVVGDLHADVYCAREWVRRSGFVDLVTWTWLGGPRKALVFLGDYVDKGPYGRHVLEFVRNLTDAFPRNVLAMLGNHDLYFLSDAIFKDGASQLMGVPVREFSYAFTHPEEYLNWLPPRIREENRTVEALHALFQALQYVYSRNAEAQVMLGPSPGHHNLFTFAPPFKGNLELAASVQAQMHEWQSHLAQGLISSGLAAWLARRPVVAVVGGALLVHGGLPSADLVALEGHLETAETLGSALERATTQTFHRLFGGQSSAAKNFHDAAGAESAELLHEAVTYRGFHGGRHGERAPCKEVRAVLSRLGPETGAELVIVGHTPGDDVRRTCDGLLAAVDSSLSRFFRAYGNRYCPVDVAMEPSPRSGCAARVSTRCEGEAALLGRAGGTWSVAAVPLLSVGTPLVTPRARAGDEAAVAPRSAVTLEGVAAALTLGAIAICWRGCRNRGGGHGKAE